MLFIWSYLCLALTFLSALFALRWGRCRHYVLYCHQNKPQRSDILVEARVSAVCLVLSVPMAGVCLYQAVLAY